MRNQIITHKHTEPTVALCLDTLAKQKQALIFVGSKRSAQKVSLDVSNAAKKIGLGQHHELEYLSEQILNTLSQPTDQCRKLAQAVKNGCAFHHAGLAPKQRELIEHAFRDGTLKLIASTPTLAAGLDMPAFRTILKDVKRYAPPWGMQYIPVLEYQQMAGRAGRPGKEDYGEAILIASSEKDIEQLEKIYIHGEVEDIFSKLAVEPVLRMYVLSLIATQLCESTQELLTFFSKTFWAHQYDDMNQLAQIIHRVITLLEEYTFITISDSTSQNDTDFLSADEVEQINSQSQRITVTQLGNRVSQLYIDPLSANHILRGVGKIQTNLGLLQLLCSTLEMRPLLRMKKKETDDINRFVFEHEDELANGLPTLYDMEYEDFYDSIKTSQYFLSWIDESSEQELFEKYDIRPGEIHAKNAMLDWLLYCTQELCTITKQKDIRSITQKLRIRVQHGVKEDIIPLLRLKHIGRVRARKLIKHGLNTIQKLKDVSLKKLDDVVGKAIAAKIKNQLGEKVQYEDTTIKQKGLADYN